MLVKVVAAQVSPQVVTEAAGDKPAEPNKQTRTSEKLWWRGVSEDNWGLSPTGADPENRIFLPFAKHLAQDQMQFWTYPFHAPRDDAKYFVPFLAFTGGLIARDNWISKQVPNSAILMNRSLNFSNYTTYFLVGGVGAANLWGHLIHNEHLSETGLLAAEAAINSTAISYALKGMAQRSRPLQGDGPGRFFAGGESFPSEHSAVAWSIASILAHEYPGTLTKLFAYGLASGVTVSRVTAKQHFAADVVVGGGLGWYFGRQVYRLHHEPELGGSGWGSDAPPPLSEKTNGNRGSPSVPLDSWVYPAFERLAALGYAPTEILGQRPWTRSECARLLDEAGELLVENETDEEALAIYRELVEEFSLEEKELGREKTMSLWLDSLYTRVTQISGPPLADGFNFGRTIVNDYGRPFEEGSNLYSGLSGYGNAGPFAFYLRAEYQHTPSGPPESSEARNAVAAQLNVQVAPGVPIAQIDRAKILEGYVSVAYKNLQLSFGKQALEWGPTETGSLLWSTNAEPILMFRLSNPHAFKLPGIFRWLGPARTDFIFGQLAGQQYVVTRTAKVIGPASFSPQPFIHGQKLSFKPTPNLEFGFSRTVVFGGFGHPLTIGSFWTSFTSVGSDYAEPHVDAGDRHSAFDVSYRIPHLRKWLTWYSDSYCEDDVLPLAAPKRCSWSPGLYVPQVPHIPKVDFRAEGVSTDVSGFAGQGISYNNSVYPMSYTNDGNIIGNWVGREGRGVQLWSTYWLRPPRKIQMGYRQQSVNRDFLKGGWLNDLTVRTDLMVRDHVSFSATAQYEKWNFPLLAANTKSNLSLSISLTYRPKWGFAH
jgi:membrane-associated phospholipid phosphatase